MSKIKLVAMDLDNTLLDSEKQISKHTEEVLKEIRSITDILKNPDVSYEEKGSLIRSVVEQIVYDKASGKMSFDIIIS